MKPRNQDTLLPRWGWTFLLLLALAVSQEIAHHVKAPAPAPQDGPVLVTDRLVAK